MLLDWLEGSKPGGGLEGMMFEEWLRMLCYRGLTGKIVVSDFIRKSGDLHMGMEMEVLTSTFWCPGEDAK